MTNQRIKFLESFIGEHFTKSKSPFAIWLHGKVNTVSEESIELEFTVRKEMTNPVGMLHGGVIAGMMDDCLGLNAFILNLEYFYPTINLNVEFFSPAKEGDTVIVKTKVVKKGKTIIHIKANMLNQTKIIIASATANMVKSNIKI